MEEAYVLNPLDIIIFALIGFGMYTGSKRGIINGATRIIAIFAGLITAFRFRGATSNFLLDYLNLNLADQTASFLGFCIAFVIGYMVISSLLGYFEVGLKRMNIGIDKALGALFGGALTTFLLSMLLFILSFVNFPSPDNARGSIAYPYVRYFAQYSLGLVPKALEEANKQIRKYGPQAFPNAPAAPPPGSDTKPKPIR